MAESTRTGNDDLAVVIKVAATAEVVAGPARLAHEAGRCGPDCDICAYEREQRSRS